jgi:hypothetical protein
MWNLDLLMATDFYSFFNEYSVEYRYHTEGQRRIVEEIVSYFLESPSLENHTNSARQVSPKELEAMGFIVRNELNLQAFLDFSP